MEKISNGDVIHLQDGRKFAVLKGKKIKEQDYCLLSTLENPVQFSIDKIRTDKSGNYEVSEYHGDDSFKILRELLGLDSPAQQEQY
jgi:hypothetical protein